MKTIYLDCFSGISGNMLLGAFLGAGVPQDYLEAELRKLRLPEAWALSVRPVSKAGIRAVFVEVQESPVLRTGAAEAQADEGDAPEEHAHHAHHQHRSYHDIRSLIQGSGLPDSVKETSLCVFGKIAEAEGKVHGRAPEEVTFHEVGALDSIIDIVGTAICLDYLGIGKIYASGLNLGRGYVRCAHGVMPVPAPAVAELVRGWPTLVRMEGDEAGELTTPTGAGIVRALAEYAESLPKALQVQTISYGAGSHEFTIPNVLRLFVGEMPAQAEKEDEESFYVLSANIDDMSAEVFGYLRERLQEAQALDVWTLPIAMKKDRPAVMLQVLVSGRTKDACTRIIFEESTTIGLRVEKLDARIACSRRLAKVTTKYGSLRVKVAAYGGRIVNVAPEYEDCRQLARENQVPLKEIMREAVKEFQFRLGG